MENGRGIMSCIIYMEEKVKINNLAFIDGQNLHMGTKECGWKVDFAKFRIYLKDKYKVTDAYYFLGCKIEAQNDLYNNLRQAGFITIFKEHGSDLATKKKGNVDTDLVFEIMKNLIDNNSFNKIIIVSGDGDYKRTINYLIRKDKFEKILFPNRKFASSLYYYLRARSFDCLENLKSYIQLENINEKGS